MNKQPPIIYNVFPLLAGTFPKWEEHIVRAHDMGFNWIFVNPIQVPGKSGSIYSIADYFRLNPALATTPEERLTELSAVLKKADALGLRAMIDLVINHCAIDSALLSQHPAWFEWEGDEPVHPWADQNGRKVVWTDLVKFNFSSTDREGLYQYLVSIVDFLVKLGFRALRCDAAYQIPAPLWSRLISEVKKKYSDVLFVAETLGCGPEQTIETAKAGFDYIFNSSKWWDFESSWLMEQYNQTRGVVSSISFPESHDTPRAAQEHNGNVEALKQRYLFSAMFSSGVMIPIGYEFGFRRRLDVVKTRPSDWEKTSIDLREYITNVNSLKSQVSVFSEDCGTEMLGHDNPSVVLMRKTAGNDQLLLILNVDPDHATHFHAPDLSRFIGRRNANDLMVCSPEFRLEAIPMNFDTELRPGQGIVVVKSTTPVSLKPLKPELAMA